MAELKQNLIHLQNISQMAWIVQKAEVLPRTRILSFKPYAEFKTFHIGISMTSAAEAKIHPDDILKHMRMFCIRWCHYRAKQLLQAVCDCTSIINTTSLYDDDTLHEWMM